MYVLISIMKMKKKLVSKIIDRKCQLYLAFNILELHLWIFDIIFPINLGSYERHD